MSILTDILSEPDGASPEPAKQAPVHVSRPVAFTFTMGVVAILAWVGGVALHKGWGADVPFIASFLVLATGLQFVKIMAHEVSHAWHQQALQAAPLIAAAQYAGAQSAKAIMDASVLQHFENLINDPKEQ